MPTTFKLPAGGVKELLKTEEGRKQLEQYRKDHADDFLQPSDPRFKVVYGNKIKENQRIELLKASLALKEWEVIKALKLTPADFSDKNYPKTKEKIDLYFKNKK